jgi:TRAP-type C4-dicarboxylate transport system permease small subunit
VARSLAGFEKGLRAAVALLVAAITILVTLQVTFRYALQAPLVWSEELTTLSYQWVSFLGAALAVRYRGHYGVDFLVRHLDEDWRGRLRGIEHAVIVLMALFLLVYGGRLVESTASQTYPTLGFSVGVGYSILPFSGLLILLMDLAVFLERRAGRP